MKRVAILKGDKPITKSSAVRMADALNEQGLDEYRIHAYRDLVILGESDGGVEVYDTTGGIPFVDYDLVYLRDFKLFDHELNALALYLHNHKVPFINTEALQFSHRTKLTQNMQFIAAGLPVPRWAYCHPSRMDEVRKKHSFSFPLILKSITGSNGWDNYMAKDEAEFATIVKKIGDGKFIMQSFVPNDFDMRIITFNDQIVCAYRRVRQSSEGHLNNVEAGARRELFEPDDELTRLAIQATKCIDRETAGIDIIQNSKTGEYAILEANLNVGMADINDGVPEAYYNKLSKLFHYYLAEL
jgi:glutathione synthase/RimK-type ligase-like ATP-grasp enzyme